MLKWMTRLLGDSANPLPADVPEVWADRLERLLEVVCKVEDGKGRKGLAADLLGFVLRGEPSVVLDEITKRPEIAERCRLKSYPYWRAEPELPDVYEHLGAVPTAVALRWARVLEASVKGQAAVCVMQLPRGIQWPEVLLLASAGGSAAGWSSLREPRGLAYTQLEAMLAEDGVDASSLLVAAFSTLVDRPYHVDQRLQMLTHLPDYPQALERHVEVLRPHLLAASVEQRLHVLAMLEPATAATLDQLAPQLCELAVAGSKQVHVEAGKLLKRCGAGVSAPLRALALRGKPERRLLALRHLHDLGTSRGAEDDVAFARETAAADKVPSIQALVGEWEAGQPAGEEEEPSAEIRIPTIDWSASGCHIPEDALERFWRDLNESIARSNAREREYHARLAAQGHKSSLYQDKPFTAGDAAELRDYLASGQPRPPERSWRLGRIQADLAQAAKRLTEVDGVGPVAMMKILLFFDIATWSDGKVSSAAIRVFNSLHRRLGQPTLLELSRLFDEAGKPGKALIHSYCEFGGEQLAADWSDEDVWPYFALHQDA